MGCNGVPNGIVTDLVRGTDRVMLSQGHVGSRQKLRVSFSNIASGYLKHIALQNVACLKSSLA